MKRFATLLMALGLMLGMVAAPSLAYAASAPAHHGDCYGKTTCCTKHHHHHGTGVQTCSNSSPGSVGATTTGVSTKSGTPSIGAATGLAFTGADVAMTVAVAFVLVGIGLVVVRLSRRRVA